MWYIRHCYVCFNVHTVKRNFLSYFISFYFPFPSFSLVFDSFSFFILSHFILTSFHVFWGRVGSDHNGNNKYVPT